MLISVLPVFTAAAAMEAVTRPGRASNDLATHPSSSTREPRELAPSFALALTRRQDNLNRGQVAEAFAYIRKVRTSERMVLQTPNYFWGSRQKTTRVPRISACTPQPLRARANSTASTSMWGP